MSLEFEIIDNRNNPVNKSGIQTLLQDIRPVWQAKRLIQRVEKLLPVDASSACQRLFNAAIHDLKEKIIYIGVDLANEAATIYKLPSVSKDEDVIQYNVSKSIDLAYRVGLLTRSEWRIIHRCYEIRRDLEHEDEEYEALLQDCFYIFKSTIDIILSRDPSELLKITDAKDLVESSSNISPTEEFLSNFAAAPVLRKKEITQMLVSFAYDYDKADIIRENSIELLRHIRPLTDKTVIIDLAKDLEQRLGRNNLDLKTAKIAFACGAIGYLKKVKLNFYFGELLEQFSSVTDWADQARICIKLEDSGGLEFCPQKLRFDLLKELAEIFIGESSYGNGARYRHVFYSDSAAPIIGRIIKKDATIAYPIIEELREVKPIKSSLQNPHLLNRFEQLIDMCITN